MTESKATRHGRIHLWLRLSLLLFVGLGSAVTYMALTLTINGQPPNRPFNGWVAVLQSDERDNDHVFLQVASGAPDLMNDNPSIIYVVEVCGSRDRKSVV